MNILHTFNLKQVLLFNFGFFLGLTLKRRRFETRIRRMKIAANLNQTGARAEADEVRIL